MSWISPADRHSEPNGAPCPHCSFQRYPLPSWATFGARFALKGAVYRIVSVASTNGRTSSYAHFEDFIYAEPVQAPWEGLPSAPAEKADVASSLKSLYTLPRFYAEDLKNALYEAM